MITFDEFKTEWLGKRVDYDHIYGFQCVDLIRQGFYEMYNLPGGGGVPSAITYWQATPDEVLQKFIRIPNSDAQKGDVVILWGLPGNADGHIGWATGNTTSTTLEILEQNGSTGNGSGTGGDAIRTRFVDRSRVAGLLRPIAVVAPTQPVQKYIVTETYPQGRQIKLNKQPTNLYGMNYDFEFMAAHPVEVHDAGEVWTVTNKVHHNDGYDYYRRDGQVDGFNVADCDDYTPPPPPPYVPPAAPVPYPEAEKYTLTSDTVLFAKAVDAANDQKAIGTLKAGSYYVYSTELGMKNLTSNASKDQKQWINPNQKLPETKPALSPAPAIESPAPIPTPVEATPLPVEQGSAVPTANAWKVSTPLRHDGSVVLYDAINPTTITLRDLEMKQRSIQMQPFNDHKPVPLVSTFMKDGVTYGRTQKVAKNFWYYGIPMDYLRPHTESILEEVEHDVAKWGDYLETPLRRAYTIISDISPVARHKVVYQAKQFVDGFKKGAKR